MHRLDTFPTKDLIQQYRTVFSSKGAAEVLTHMLFDLGVFQPLRAEEDVVLANYGNRLLAILAGGEIDENNLKELTKRIMRQPLPREADES